MQKLEKTRAFKSSRWTHGLRLSPVRFLLMYRPVTFGLWYYIITVIFYAIGGTDAFVSALTSSKMVVENDSFLYFAYGSNLLQKRMLLSSPSAEFVTKAKLNDYQLNFIKYAEVWHGCIATIVPVNNSHVWGAVWKLNNRDIPGLDRQEGVNSNWYFPKVVDVISPDNQIMECRTYQQCINPAAGDISILPKDRQPSITYLDCIIQGAIECELPTNYVDKLKTIPDNGKIASKEMIDKLKS